LTNNVSYVYSWPTLVKLPQKTTRTRKSYPFAFCVEPNYKIAVCFWNHWC